MMDRLISKDFESAVIQADPYFLYLLHEYLSESRERLIQIQHETLVEDDSERLEEALGEHDKFIALIEVLGKRRTYTPVSDWLH